MNKHVIVAVVQGLLVLSVWGKYQLERSKLPKAWARVAGYDPYDVMRGRYIRLRVLAYAPELVKGEVDVPVRAVARDGVLRVERAECCAHVRRFDGAEAEWVALEPGAMSYYLPEGVEDPSIRKEGEVLWAEVSIPERGAPRPLRLWKGKEGEAPPGVVLPPVSR